MVIIDFSDAQSWKCSNELFEVILTAVYARPHPDAGALEAIRRADNFYYLNIASMPSSLAYAVITLLKTSIDSIDPMKYFQETFAEIQSLLTAEFNKSSLAIRCR